MRLSVTGVVPLSFLILSGCSAEDGGAAVRSKAGIQSVHSDLSGGSCKKEFDKSDPNETPYLLCPGVAGYALIVRHVGSGRKSIDIVNAEQRVLPLEYQEFITRHMSTLGGKAEWRVATRDGKQVPLALIVPVQAREDDDNPEKVTRTYLAIAKIAPNEACVTDRIPEGTQSNDEVRNVADSARERPCVLPRPPMTADGVVIR